MPNEFQPTSSLANASFAKVGRSNPIYGTTRDQILRQALGKDSVGKSLRGQVAEENLWQSLGQANPLVHGQATLVFPLVRKTHGRKIKQGPN